MKIQFSSVLKLTISVSFPFLNIGICIGLLVNSENSIDGVRWVSQGCVAVMCQPRGGLKFRAVWTSIAVDFCFFGRFVSHNPTR